MELISNLSLGFGVAFTPINLLYALIGCPFPWRPKRYFPK